MDISQSVLKYPFLSNKDAFLGLTPQVVQLPGSAVLGYHEILVKLEGRESDRHLGDNTGSDSTQTLVQSERRLLLDNPHSDADEREVAAL